MSCKRKHTEEADTDVGGEKRWKEKVIIEVLKRYSDQIYSADKTSLYYKATDRMMERKSETS